MNKLKKLHILEEVGKTTKWTLYFVGPFGENAIEIDEETALEILALKQIDEEISKSKKSVEESYKLAPNSYASGYDKGYLDALMDI